MLATAIVHSNLHRLPSAADERYVATVIACCASCGSDPQAFDLGDSAEDVALRFAIRRHARQIAALAKAGATLNAILGACGWVKTPTDTHPQLADEHGVSLGRRYAGDVWQAFHAVHAATFTFTRKVRA